MKIKVGLIIKLVKLFSYNNIVVVVDDINSYIFS